MSDTEYTADDLDDMIGTLPDGELTELMHRIGDEVQLRLLYGTPLYDK